MSKIAVLSDIHGNSAALQAVLEEAAHQDAAEYFILGDFIGYYHRPLEVFQLLEHLSCRISAIQGNHERMLAKVLQGEFSWEDIGRKYGHGLEMAAKQLGQEKLAWLLNLPKQRIVERAGKRFLLCHGSPLDPDHYIYPDAKDMEFDFSGIEADYVLMGHTHYPMIRAGKNFTVINPGSVGQARDRGGFAAWCIVDTDNDVVTMRYTPYDVTPMLQDCEKYDPDVPYLQEVLLRR